MDKNDVIHTHTHTHTHTHAHTLDYYSAIRKNEILPFATIWMNLEHIMLSVLIFNIVDEYKIVYFIFFCNLYICLL